MAAITAKAVRAHEIFYLGESTVGAVRIDDYKYRFIDQPNGWLGDKTHRTCLTSRNLRLIRSSARAGQATGRKTVRRQYFDWFKYQFWRFVFVQQLVGKEIQTFLDYPRCSGRELQSDAVKAGDAEKDGRGGSSPKALAGNTDALTAAGSSWAAEGNESKMESRKEIVMTALARHSPGERDCGALRWSAHVPSRS